MANDARIDHSDLPQATPEEIRLLLRRAGLDLPEELLQQFLAEQRPVQTQSAEQFSFRHVRPPFPQSIS